MHKVLVLGDVVGRTFRCKFPGLEVVSRPEKVLLFLVTVCRLIDSQILSRVN